MGKDVRSRPYSRFCLLGDSCKVQNPWVHTDLMTPCWGRGWRGTSWQKSAFVQAFRDPDVLPTMNPTAGGRIRTLGLHSFPSIIYRGHWMAPGGQESDLQTIPPDSRGGGPSPTVQTGLSWSIRPPGGRGCARSVCSQSEDTSEPGLERLPYTKPNQPEVGGHLGDATVLWGL